MITASQYLRIALNLRLKKARALLLFLLHPVNRAHRTEMVMDLLWRDIDTKKANASFRQAVRQLRLTSAEIAPLDIQTGSGTIAINAPKDWSIQGDLQTGLADPAAFQASVDDLRIFLEQLELLLNVSESFDNWVDVTRSRTVAGVQDSLASHYDRPDTSLAAEAAALALELEPHVEAAARCLMKHHWAGGSWSRAIEVYNKLYAHLDETYDQEPETETVELLASIKLKPDGGGAALQRNVRRKIVLDVVGGANPDVNWRVSSYQSVLVADLKSRLKSFREWNVKSEGSDDEEALRISLNLVPDGARYRLNVTLEGASQAEPIWTGHIDDPHNNWLDKVRALIVRIANALRVVVADRQRSDLAADLYDRWLTALALKSTWTGEDADQAVEILKEIAEEAVDFGQAHAELAGIYNVRHILRPGTYQSTELSESALTHALESIALDPVDTRAHRVLAWCYCHTGEFDLAEFHFDQSQQLNPQNEQTIASSALGYAFSGNYFRAQEQIEAIARLPGAMVPFHLIYLAACNYLLGNFETAAEQCGTGAGLMPTVGGWHSAALAKLGRWDEARQVFDAYCQDIGAKWCGEDPATPESIIDWFVSCFPLREEAVRRDLRDTLTLLAQWQGTAAESLRSLT